MKIVVATDSYKGTFSAESATRQIAEAVRAQTSGIEVIAVPIADGGEGTLDSYIASTEIAIKESDATTPDRKKIKAEYGLLPNGVAIIESAKAIGLTRITTEKNPLTATSYGLGEVIKTALNAGATSIYITLGDSGINDGGIGMAVALGAKCYDNEGYEFLPTGGTLTRLAGIDFTGIDARIYNTKIVGLADVSNPLLGKSGATQVFAKQKGAQDTDFDPLENGLKQLLAICVQEGKPNHSKTPSSGAAGGVGYGILTFLNGTMQSGIATVMAQVGLQKKSAGADIIITGEGKLDRQTMGGKAISGVAKIAETVGAKLIAVVGINELTAEEYSKIGITSVYTLTNSDFNEVVTRIIKDNI